MLSSLVLVGFYGILRRNVTAQLDDIDFLSWICASCQKAPNFQIELSITPGAGVPSTSSQVLLINMLTHPRGTTTERVPDPRSGFRVLTPADFESLPAPRPSENPLRLRTLVLFITNCRPVVPLTTSYFQVTPPHRMLLE